MSQSAKQTSSLRWLLVALPVLVAGAAAAFLLFDLGGETRAPVDVSPAKFDFGRIRFGVNEVARFKIRNNSDRAVTVRGAHANCACFGVKRKPTVRLSAGEETEIVLELRSAMTAPTKFRGKRLNIETDHPKAPIIQVPLEGEIFSPFWISPEAIDAGMVGDEESDFDWHRVEVHQEKGFKVGLETRLTGYEGGWRADHADLLEIETEELADGIAFKVRLRKEGRSGVNQIRSGFRIALVVSGTDMPEERIFKSIKIRGNWVPK